MDALLIDEARLIDLAAYIEAGRLIAGTLRDDGIAAELTLLLDSDGGTLVLHTRCDPARVSATLKRRHLRFDLNDFHDDDEKTVATWQITFLHHSFGLVATLGKGAMKVAA